MKLQDQVITLEQAKRLKELGVNAETFMTWMEVQQLNEQGDHKAWIPALFVDIPSGGHDITCVSELPDGCTDEDNECNETRGNYPAYTVAELGVMMPDDGDGAGIYFTWKDRGNFKGEEIDGFSAFMNEDGGYNQSCNTGYCLYPTEAQARGALLIHLLEKKIITPEQCNASLEL